MTKLQEYTARYSDRDKSILPQLTQDACFDLGKALGSASVGPDQIGRFRKSLRGVGAEAVPQASDEIRAIAKIYPYATSHVSRDRFLWRLFEKPDGTLAQLNQYPELGWLLIFHGNGFARQAALEALPDAPQCPFEFCAIVYRLNDWVENVRQAAVAYCNKHFEYTPAEVVAESTFFLLHYARSLKRWRQVEQKLLEEVIYRADVVQQLKIEFLKIRTGRVGHTFRQISRRPEFDQFHLEFSTEAALPSVRAIATESLLTQRARWFIGHRKEWVDKRFGISRRIAEFDSRQIKIAHQSDSLLENAALDRSAQVRKVAADALIVRRHKASDKLDQIAQRLAGDPNSSVRSRVEFYLKNRLEDN